MDSSLYTAYSGLRTTADLLDILSNNLANLSTTGFKSDSGFLSIYNHAISADGAGSMDAVANDSSNVLGTVSNFLAGAIKETGRDLDVAIEDKGFLVVQGPSGELYTRNGHLQVNSERRLVNPEGFPVLGESGPIQLPPGTVVISAAGQIQVNGAAVDTLRVVDFGEKRGLTKVGNTSFRSAVAGVPVDAGERTVRQGSLEQSNVNPIKEMMLMISAQRQFDAMQKTITTVMNTVDERSINQVGRVGG